MPVDYKACLERAGFEPCGDAIYQYPYRYGSLPVTSVLEPVTAILEKDGIKVDTPIRRYNSGGYYEHLAEQFLFAIAEKYGLDFLPISSTGIDYFFKIHGNDAEAVMSQLVHARDIVSRMNDVNIPLTLFIAAEESKRDEEKRDKATLEQLVLQI